MLCGLYLLRYAGARVEFVYKLIQILGLFVYAGPSLPHGRLKEHAVFNGTFEDVKAYLADVLEDYPQAERLIVPVERLSAFAAKVKTPGNIAHKYYNDIVSTMRGNKEV